MDADGKPAARLRYVPFCDVWRDSIYHTPELPDLYRLVADPECMIADTHNNLLHLDSAFTGAKILIKEEAYVEYKRVQQVRAA